VGNEDEFHLWLNQRRSDWLQWRADGGSLMTFADYIAAREAYLREKDRG
jgi:hypothetical protein